MLSLMLSLMQKYVTWLHVSQWLDAQGDLKLSKALFTSRQGNRSTRAPYQESPR